MSDERPHLRVVSGSPTAEEVAVVTALLAAASAAGGDGAPPPHRGGWSHPARRLRQSLLPGPNAWRSRFQR